MSIHTPYRWCIVSKCNNTTTKTPDKLFVRVPTDINKRNVWLELSGRDPKTLSKKSALHLCEDHFDMEKDMENYMRLKIMGSVKKIIMKPNAVPSKFGHAVLSPGPAVVSNSARVIPGSTKRVKQPSQALSQELHFSIPLTACVKTEVVIKEEAEEASVNEEVCEYEEFGAHVKKEAECENSSGWCELYQGHRGEGELVVGPEEMHRARGPSTLPGVERSSHPLRQGLHFTTPLTACVKTEVVIKEEAEEVSVKEEPEEFSEYEESQAHVEEYQSHQGEGELVVGPVEMHHCIPSIAASGRRTEWGIEGTCLVRPDTHDATETSSPTNPTYMCDECGKGFTNKSDLRKHIHTHISGPPDPPQEMMRTGEKRYKCDSCDFKCNSKFNYRRHQMIHNGEKPFKCSHCDYKCRRKSDLQRHERQHNVSVRGAELGLERTCSHDGADTSSTNPTYLCDECGKGFTDKSDLRKHTHSRSFHPYAVNIPRIRTKRFAATFIMRTAKEWNSLPASVFPEHYNLGVFKARVNRLFLDGHDSSSATSSLNIR